MVGRFGTAVYALCYQMGNLDDVGDVGIAEITLQKTENGATTILHRADGSKPAARFWVSTNSATVRVWATSGSKTVVLSQCIRSARCTTPVLTLFELQGERLISRVDCTPSREFGVSSDGAPISSCDIEGIEGSTSGSKRTVFSETKTIPLVIAKLATP
jgi:hypothetical protein